ncbi:hypothetical protein ABPG72_018417 [Tetrahymena utriculariae]
MSSLFVKNYKINGILNHNKKNECLELTNNQLLDCIFFSDINIEQNCCVEFRQNKLQRFESEIETFKSKNDNNQYTKIHNFFRKEDGYLLIVNRNICGSLHTFLEQNKFSQKRTCFAKIIVSILQGLINIHSKQIIYTCISPFYLKLDANQKVIYEENTYERVFQDYSNFQQNEYFLAPEILEGKEYGFEADIYSFGVLLFYMIYKKYPFNGNDSKDLIQKIELNQITFDQNIKVPLSLIDFIKRLLHYDPQQRMSWYQVYMHPFLKGYIQQLTDDQNLNEANNYDEEDLINQQNKLLQSKQLYQQERFQAKAFFQKSNIQQKPNNTQKKKISPQKEKEEIAPNRQEAMFLKAKFLYQFTDCVIKLCKKLDLDYSQTQLYLTKQAFDILEMITKDNEAKQNLIKKLNEINDINQIFRYNNLLSNSSSFQKEYNDTLKLYINRIKEVLDRPLDEDKSSLFRHIMLAFEALNIKNNNLQEKNYFKSYKESLKLHPPCQWEKMIAQRLSSLQNS